MPAPSRSSLKPASCAEHPRARQRGLSLIELVMALVIISVAVAGTLMVFNTTVRGSADPLVRKQALAVAEALLNEVLAQPYTYCDPQDPAYDAAPPPASAAACSGPSQATPGPTPGESRFSATNPYDNVGDYHGYTSTGFAGLDGAAVPGLADYTVSVSVTQAGATFSLPADAALRVAVRVTGRGESVTLIGYRMRYAPNVTG